MDGPIHVALALVQDDRGWLVSRRAAGRIFAGLWEFPGGKMEVGESAEQAAVREAAEETGIAVEVLGVLGELWTVNAGRQATLHLVHCRYVSGDPAPCDPAVLEVRWVSLSELAELPMPPVNAEILERLRMLAL